MEHLSTTEPRLNRRAWLDPWEAIRRAVWRESPHWMPTSEDRYRSILARLEVADIERKAARSAKARQQILERRSRKAA